VSWHCHVSISRKCDFLINYYSVFALIGIFSATKKCCWETWSNCQKTSNWAEFIKS